MYDKQQLRHDIGVYLANGYTQAEISRIMQVSDSTIGKVLMAWRKEEHCETTFQLMYNLGFVDCLRQSSRPDKTMHQDYRARDTNRHTGHRDWR